MLRIEQEVFTRLMELLDQQLEWNVEHSKQGSSVIALITTDSLWQTYSLSQQVLTGCNSGLGIVCPSEKGLTSVWQSIVHLC